MVKFANNKIMKKFLFCFFSIISLIFVPASVFADGDSLSQSEIRVFREKFVAEAKKHEGETFTKGKRGPSTFDEAGFVHFCAQTQLEMILPTNVRGLYDFAQIVADSEREPGDLVFFRSESSSQITEIGIYLGSGKFMSCSKNMGSKSGVHEYSLSSSPWKKAYAGTGKLLGQSGLGDTLKTSSLSSSKTSSKSNKTTNKSSNKSSSKTSNKNSSSDSDSDSSSDSSGSSSSSNRSSSSSRSSKNKNRTFSDRLYLSSYLSGDWSLFTEKRFMPNFRGLTAFSIIDYEGDEVTPGAGFELRWNNGANLFQIPLVFSLKAGDYVRFYAGPVFSIGEATAPDTNDEISASIFPGIFGMTIYLPSFTSGDFKVQVIQDINYTFFNDVDGSMLNPLKSLATGIEFSTGVSVTLPMSMLF